MQRRFQDVPDRLGDQGRTVERCRPNELRDLRSLSVELAPMPEEQRTTERERERESPQPWRKKQRERERERFA